MAVERINHQGHESVRLSNSAAEVVVWTDVGPRIMHYSLAGGRNVFKEITSDEEQAFSGDEEWKLYGGHRIWVGPEERSYTYAADNEPCAVMTAENSVTATAPTDSVGIQKEIAVTLDESTSEVTVRHRLTNRSPWPLRLAPWALSMMRTGGVGVTTFPPRGTHPEHLQPSNPLVMWRFTHLSDPRWTLMREFLSLRNDPTNDNPQKLGTWAEQTRGAYLIDGDLFVKRYEAQPGVEYPDMGTSFQMFTNHMVLELETLGPMVTLRPDDSVDHTESWSLHAGVVVDTWNDDALNRVVRPLLG